MDLSFLVDLFLHLDKHLAEVIQAYGPWTYALLFTICVAAYGVGFLLLHTLAPKLEKIDV